MIVDPERDIDLTPDVEEARQRLEPRLRRLTGCLQLWNIMTCCHRMALAYAQDRDQLRWEAKMAYTKAIVVEYWRPWSGNRRNPGLKSAADSRQLRQIRGSRMHGALHQLRNSVVAHADQDFEGQGLTLVGTTVQNPDTPFQLRTLRRVFLPTRQRISSSRSMWWLEDPTRLQELCVHLQAAVDAATQVIRSTAANFIEEAFHHIHVLEYLPDLFTLEPIDAPAFPMVEMPSQHLSPTPNLSTTPEPLLLGDSNIVSFVTIYQVRDQIPMAEIRGNGFVIRTIPDPSSDTAQITVVFPLRRETDDAASQ